MTALYEIAFHLAAGLVFVHCLRARRLPGRLFAVYLVKPSPFCMLDEADAPLDDVNIGRFVNMLREFSRNTQFLVITHNKLTMETANHLYGVTMMEPGVSNIVSVSFHDVAATQSDQELAGAIADQRTDLRALRSAYTALDRMRVNEAERATLEERARLAADPDRRIVAVGTTSLRALEAFDRMGVESVAVCLLHAYANPCHEQLVAELIGSRAPHLALHLFARLPRSPSLSSVPLGVAW